MFRERKRKLEQTDIDWAAAHSAMQKAFFEIQPLIKEASDPGTYHKPEQAANKQTLIQKVGIKGSEIEIQLTKWPVQVGILLQADGDLEKDPNKLDAVRALRNQICKQTGLKHFTHHNYDQPTNQTWVSIEIKPDIENFALR